MAKAIRKSEDSGLETSKDLVTVPSDAKAKGEVSDCFKLFRVSRATPADQSGSHSRDFVGNNVFTATPGHVKTSRVIPKHIKTGQHSAPRAPPVPVPLQRHANTRIYTEARVSAKPLYPYRLGDEVANEIFYWRSLCNLEAP